MLPSASFLLFLFLFVTSSAAAGAANYTFDFDFPSLAVRNLTLLGDSYFRDGVVGLTREVTVPTSSSGSVIYNNPIPFSDSDSPPSAASFSSRFTFSVANVNPSSFGDGLAFFLSRDNQTMGSPGGYLGLVNASLLTKNKFVAVEFDTRVDPHFGDPNENHVGLDIDSLISVKTADPLTQGIDLKSGDPITAWVDYDVGDLNNPTAAAAILQVFLSYSSTSKPQDPLLSVDVDLSDYLKGDMYVGFSGSTEGSTELHSIHNWSFNMTRQGLSPSSLRPRSTIPHNVSESSIIITSPDIPSSSNPKNKNHKKLGLGLGIAGPSFFCAFLVVFGYISFKKLQRMRSSTGKTELVTGRPKEFNYRELSSATRGFHASRIIGKGAFGNVYKAFFVSTGTLAAVKRSKHSHEGKTEFLAELSIIAGLRHKNLVQLLGWCVEKGELLLVYEFMPHSSLDKVLHHQDSSSSGGLSWAQRRNVAVGLASALTYLHEECEKQVIHRDIKSSNVMLDVHYKARLGDFGLARLMEHDKSPVSTLTAGTMGYLAPEYLHYGKATEKTDVFSYGVVLLEVGCGRRPIERESESQKMVNLVDWVWGLYGEGKLLEAADERLNGEFDVEEMRKMLMIGLSCANPDSGERPNMRKVLQMLNGEVEVKALAKTKPTLTFSSGFTLSLQDITSDSEY